ncbi:hypothetical protein CDAR_59881 [Caerostris darwini]|uniref:Uncharacterized protein n=1 Tax=Caerostris darwini TaxID=1538125 RepID=A0AAV4RNG8_9ARAC|nr:hypothetical protein CDAR_59881 [Caerostris darwini]
MFYFLEETPLRASVNDAEHPRNLLIIQLDFHPPSFVPSRFRSPNTPEFIELQKQIYSQMKGSVWRKLSLFGMGICCSHTSAITIENWIRGG